MKRGLALLMVASWTGCGGSMGTGGDGGIDGATGADLGEQDAAADAAAPPALRPDHGFAGAGKRLHFTASEPVTWSVQEGDAGGTITSAGVYTAPATLGTYHVIAAATADPGRSGTAEVQVVAPTLAVLTGAPGGSGFLDGTGGGARLYGGLGMASDGAGHVYISDTNTIRELDLATGALSTLLGDWLTMDTTDGSFASARSFGAPPLAFVAGGAGKLFIGNFSSLRVADLGAQTVTTVQAKTGATNLNLNGVTCLTSDGATTLYVCGGDHKIWSIDASTLQATLIAGTGGVGEADGPGAAATFSALVGLALVGTHLYVAESNGPNLRQIDLAAATRDVSIVAPYSGARGLIAGPPGTLYAFNSSVVHTVDLAGPSVTVLAGGGPSDGQGADGVGPAAAFEQLQAGVSSAGTLYLLDNSGTVVRAVTPANMAVTTVAGSRGNSGYVDGAADATRFESLGGLTDDGSGTLYVGEAGASRIRRIQLADGSSATISAGNSAPFGLYYRDKRLFVASLFDHTLWGIDFATQTQQLIAGKPGVGDMVDGVGTMARLDNPYGIAGLPDGALVVSEGFFGDLRKVVLDPVSGLGTVTTLVPNVRSPTGLATDASGRVYFSQNGSGAQIKVYDPATSMATVLAGSDTDTGYQDGAGATALFGDDLEGMALDLDGNLYVADSSNYVVRKIVVATGEVSTVVGSRSRLGVQAGPLPASLSSPLGLRYVPTGELLITDVGENVILTVRGL